MNTQRIILYKLRKIVLLIIIFAAFPAFIASSFQRGCYILCVASNHPILDYISGTNGYLTISRDGLFRVVAKDDPCNTYLFDTLLYAGGLNAIESAGIFRIVIAGNNGRIFRGFDLVYTPWQQINSGTNADLNNIGRTRFNDIFIAGDSGVVLKSTDDGASFFRQNSGTVLNLNEIYCIEKFTGTEKTIESKC